MADSANKKMGIVVGGGPAPGINSVIGASTISARLHKVEVVGILDGFEWLMKKDLTHTVSLEIDDVSRIHFRGGSYLGTSRKNPTKDPKDTAAVIDSLENLGINRLVTIGGDDTLFSAQTIEKASQGRIHVVHVPKTIDNDLALPHGISTFGFETARHLGVSIVKNLMVDALTTHRWYFVVAMGRKAGHLNLGIGKSAGATLSIIPEEFDGKVSFDEVADILVGSIVKRLAYGRKDGVALLAEGLVELMDPQEFESLQNVERDEHGHIRLAEISFGDIMKAEVRSRLAKLGIKMTIVSKNIGYELRCVDPIPFDIAYTKDLGFLAAHHVLNGGTAALITVQNAQFVPIPFSEMLDPKTGKSMVRMVDTKADSYRISRANMLRLKKSDFENEATLGKLAGVVNLSTDEFKKRFGYLAKRDTQLKEFLQQPLVDESPTPALR